MNHSVTTISIFRYKGFAAKLWALSQMQFGHNKLGRTPGLRFYKLLGSGGGSGFSWKPEWGRYGLLAVWENESCANNFFQNHPLYSAFLSRCFENFTVFLSCQSAHGHWSGKRPFDTEGKVDKGDLVAVLTRATIKPRFTLRFWLHVAEVARSLQTYPERLLSVGIGEWPIVQQATFSIWENKEAMLDFAYKNPVHATVVKKNKAEGWFGEELFARFSVLRVTGNWQNEQLDKLKSLTRISAK